MRRGRVHPALSLLQELRQKVDQNYDDDQPYQDANYLVHPLSSSCYPASVTMVTRNTQPGTKLPLFSPRRTKKGAGPTWRSAITGPRTQ